AAEVAQSGGGETRIPIRGRGGRRIRNDGGGLFRVFDRLRMRCGRRRQQAQNGKADPIPTGSHVALPTCKRRQNKTVITAFPPTIRGCAKPTRPSLRRTTPVLPHANP